MQVRVALLSRRVNCELLAHMRTRCEAATQLEPLASSGVTDPIPDRRYAGAPHTIA